MENKIKYVNTYKLEGSKNGYVCGVGIIDGKEYEFYTDGEAPNIWVDVHKAWIKDNEVAWCGEKSKEFKFFSGARTYINKLFNGNVQKMKPIGFKEVK